jgi:hypothetical protein
VQFKGVTTGKSYAPENNLKLNVVGGIQEVVLDNAVK